MNRTNKEQTIKFLQSVLDKISVLQTFDSKVRDDGWTVTSKARQYVAFNKYAHVKCNKVIYTVFVRKSLCCLCVKLNISASNPKVDDFRKAVEGNGETFHNLNGNRDRGVERHLTLNGDGDVNAAISIVLNELDALYKTYNVTVDVGCMPRRKCSCRNPVSVEILSGQNLNPEYNLHWKGWKQFYDEWDDFVKNWFESGTKPVDDLTQALELTGAFRWANTGTRLDEKEIPEPYYGSGENAKCVVVNLNPGTSSEVEKVKIFGKSGFLMESFEQKCCKRYSLFAEKWSPLRESYCDGIGVGKVPGNVWWYNINRKNFFKRFFGVEHLTDLFSLEACPYHSKGWSGGLDAIEKHVINKVITPAAVIAERNNNCAVLVGSAFNTVIAKIKGVEAIGRWRGTRVYSLYKLTRPIGGLNNRNPIFLLVVNGTQGMFLPKSNELNDAIEKIIYDIVH